MAEAEQLRIVLWLDDKKEEIRDEVDDLIKHGFQILTARDVIEFQNEVQELQAAGHLDCLELVVLDIMLEGVIDLSRYYPGVKDGSTSNGYAAGLVFLERILVTEEVFKDIKRVPIALNSKRAMSEVEKHRIRKAEVDHGVKVHIFEKTGRGEIKQHLFGSALN